MKERRCFGAQPHLPLLATRRCGTFDICRITKVRWHHNPAPRLVAHATHPHRARTQGERRNSAPERLLRTRSLPLSSRKGFHSPIVYSHELTLILEFFCFYGVRSAGSVCPGGRLPPAPVFLVHVDRKGLYVLVHTSMDTMCACTCIACSKEHRRRCYSIHACV